jgi:Tfp pilus assembly protein PilE
MIKKGGGSKGFQKIDVMLVNAATEYQIVANPQGWINEGQTCLPTNILQSGCTINSAKSAKKRLLF